MKKKISKEEVERVFGEIYKESELSEVGPVGGGWYKLPGGGWTGKAGWEMFNKALEEEFKKYAKENTGPEEGNSVEEQ